MRKIDLKSLFNKYKIIFIFVIIIFLIVVIYNVSYAYFIDKDSRTILNAETSEFSNSSINVNYYLQNYKSYESPDFESYNLVNYLYPDDLLYVTFDEELSSCSNGSSFFDYGKGEIFLRTLGKTTCDFYYSSNGNVYDAVSYANVYIQREDDYSTYDWTHERVEDLLNQKYVINIDRTYCDNAQSVEMVEDFIFILSSDPSSCHIYMDVVQSMEYGYTGRAQEYIVNRTGYYLFEAWGASGGDTEFVQGGDGAYTAGEIYLNRGDIIYVYVGYGPQLNETVSDVYNGGSSSGNFLDTVGYSTTASGGATDFRLYYGEWDNTSSLNSRIMVAGAGGSTAYYYHHMPGANAGGLTGYSAQYVTYGSGLGPQNSKNISASQTNGGSVNADTHHEAVISHINGFGTGNGRSAGGYYASPAYETGGRVYSGFGGSSYISGHTGSVAITGYNNQTPLSGCLTGTTNNNCSHHYSNYIFEETVMIDGAGYSWSNTKDKLVKMPSPDNSDYNLGEGHEGSGYAKITVLYD